MKFAHVATRWIGTGVPPDDKYRLDMPIGCIRVTDMGSQFVNLAKNCPSPNIALALVREMDGDYIDGLKSSLNQIVLETWQDDGPVVPAATALRFKNFLKRQDMDDDMAEAIVDATDRTQTLLSALEDLDKRSRRRIELGL